MPHTFGFIEPCIPITAAKPPAGDRWVHEIKHDGYRMLIRRDGDSVRLFTRRGLDWADRHPWIAASARAIRADSFVIDGECVVFGADGLPDFELLRSRAHDSFALLMAFDLLELVGDDLRKLPLLVRKARLADLLGPYTGGGISYNQHFIATGEVVFRAACKLGLEGIVSKVATSTYASGSSPAWVKVQNPDGAAARRIATEE